MHVPAQIHQCNRNAKENDEGSEEVCKEEESGDEDAGESDPEVAKQLLRDHFVRLPVAVLLGESKDIAREFAVCNYLLHFVQSWYVLTPPLKLDVGECESGEED